MYVNPGPSDEWEDKLISLAVTQCVVKHKDSGKLVALAEHGKSALNVSRTDGQRGHSNRVVATRGLTLTDLTRLCIPLLVSDDG